MVKFPQDSAIQVDEEQRPIPRVVSIGHTFRLPRSRAALQIEMLHFTLKGQEVRRAGSA